MKRAFAVTFLVGTGMGLVGCQSPGLGGLAFWKGNNAAVGSTAPDVGQQKYAGLSQQLGNRGANSSASVGIGGPRTNDDSFFAASWKKTTAAMGGAMAVTPKVTAPEDDPTRLDKMPKKIGPEVYIGAARLLENQGKFPEAEEKYREALRAAPNDLNTLISMARLYDRQGQGQKAIEMYQKASQAHPTSGLVFNDAGMCFRRQRQIEKAVIAFKKAVELTPDNVKYRNNLAATLVEAGRSNEAYAAFAATNPAAVAHFNLAYLLQQKGQRADAERHLHEAVAIDPTFTPAREVLAKLGSDPGPLSAAEQPRGPLAPQPNFEPSPDYAAGAAEQPLYTSAPRVEGFAAAEPPAVGTDSQSFHINDDSGPNVETAQHTNWASASWAISKPGKPRTSQPLPPTD